MPETCLELFSDLTQRKLCDSSGATVTLPPLYQGDTLVCTMTVLDKDPNNSNQYATRNFNVRSLAATIGLVLTPPGAGQWAVRAPDPNHDGSYLAVAALDNDCSAAEIVTAFNTAFESAGWTATCTIPQLNGTNVPGVWVICLAGVASSPVSFQPTTNTLSPDSIIRVQAYQDGGNWYYEFRLIQSPFSWNEAGFQTVLASEPTVTRLISGRAATEEGLPPQNEVQVLNWPEDFVGTIFVNWNGYTSGVISNVSGPSGVAQALNQMIPDGSNPFTVTLPVDDQNYITFGGEFAGTPENLMTVTVNTYAPGILTFALPLDREELAAALRAAAGNNVTAMLEITLEVVPDGDDPTDPSVPGVFITLCQQSVTIFSKVGWNGLTALAPINFLQPSSPTNYVPYGQNQVITGQCHYITVFSDGVHSSYAIVHALGTVLLACPPMVAENVLPARIYAYGLDFDATIDSVDQVTLRFAYVPAAGLLTVCITTAGPISAFVSNITVTIAQVTGLQAFLNMLNGEVATLQALVPTGTLVAQASASGAAQNFTLPNAYFAYPNRRLPAGFDASTLLPPTAAALAALPRSPVLLPAIHTASVTTFESADLPDDPEASVVYQNAGTDPVYIPGGGGRESNTLPVGGYVGYNGKYWYLLRRAGTTNSYFPADFETQLIPDIDQRAALWQAGQGWTFQFDLITAVIAANISAEVELVVEFGVARSQTSPAQTAPNLSKIDWFAVPLLTQRLVLSGLAQTRHFGVALKRSTTNKMTAQKLLQSAWSVADACPLDPDFMLRARLVNFDISNCGTSPVGYFCAGILNATVTIQ
jgi:hypothetical protein